MIDRREFIRVAVLASGAVVFGISCGSSQRRTMLGLAESSGSFAPNAWLTIMPNNRVSVAVEKLEMGQGVLTSHAMLVAEELDMPLTQVDAVSADAAPQYRTSFGVQQTGGSTSMKESWAPMRRAAASAREMLVAAASAQWGVLPADCTTVAGEVHHAASGRSAKYSELAVAAAQQPIPKEPTVKSRADYKLVGTEAPRVDLRAKVDGTARFGLDVVVPNMLKAYVIRPPVLGAEPLVVRAEAARAEPGVVDVIQYHRGVAVLAEKYWQARRAAAKIEVDWTESPLEGVFTADLESLARTTAAGAGKASHRSGNVRRARKRATTRIDVSYEVPYLAHATLEPLNCTAHVRDDVVEVWAPTQTPSLVERVASTMCGTPAIVHVTLAGGAFGRKAAPDFIVDAIAIAKRTSRPVQVVWSREDDMRGGYYRPMAHIAMQGALDGEGTPVAWRGHTVSQPLSTDVFNLFTAALPPLVGKRQGRELISSAVGMFRAGVLPEFLSLEGAAELPYTIANQSIEFTPLQTTIPVAFWRAVGHSYNGFVVESFIDELAVAAGADPYEYRKRHMHDARLLACLDRVAAESGWATAVEPGYGRGIAAHKSFGTYVAQVVEAGLVDGRVDIKRITCVVDCGVVVNPDIVRMNMEGGIVFGLSASLHQKITFEDGRVVQGNYDDYPLARMYEVPATIDVHIVDSDADPSGVGEPGLPPLAPALANALFAASGIRLRRMPFMDALAELEEAK